MFQSRIGAIVLLGASSAFAESIPVPNFSFEAPPVVRDEQNPFGALPFLDDWDETAVGQADEFDQNTGVFLNTDPGSPDRITNAHLDRLGFVSSLIGNDVRQQLGVTYLPGHAYRLTVGIGKSATFPVSAEEQLEIALFYFVAGAEQIIASTFVSGSQVGTTFLLDFSANISFVDPQASWANQPIGVLIRPSRLDADDSAGEGFWNLDFVRLEKSDGAVPAASTWGLAITALLLATCGTIALCRRRTQRAGA